MADRVTIKHARIAFHHFITELGGTTTEAARRAGQDITGTYMLEGTFGRRYRVIRFGERGAEYTPMGNETRPAREMHGALSFATDALREAKRLAALS